MIKVLWQIALNVSVLSIYCTDCKQIMHSDGIETCKQNELSGLRRAWYGEQ